MATLTESKRGIVMKSIKQWVIGGVLFVIVVALAASCGSSSSSSSGRKWSDLSDVEKQNAKWAYEAQKYINSK